MRIIRLKEVIDSTGLARSTIYKYIAEGTFPKPVSLGDRCFGRSWRLCRMGMAEFSANSPRIQMVQFLGWHGNVTPH